MAGNVSWLFQGSNEFYLKLQVRDHPYRVATLEVSWSGSGGWHAMARSSDNFFEYSQGQPIPFPISVRATDLYGHVLTDAIQTLVNDVPIPGHAQFALCSGIFVDGFATGTATPRWSLAEPYTPPRAGRGGGGGGGGVGEVVGGVCRGSRTRDPRSG